MNNYLLVILFVVSVLSLGTWPTPAAPWPVWRYVAGVVIVVMWILYAVSLAHR